MCIKNPINLTHLDEIKLKIRRLIHANWVGFFVSNAEFVRKVVAEMPSLGFFFFFFIQDIYYYNYKELLKKKLIAMF